MPNQMPVCDVTVGTPASVSRCASCSPYVPPSSRLPCAGSTKTAAELPSTCTFSGRTALRFLGGVTTSPSSQEQRPVAHRPTDQDGGLDRVVDGVLETRAHTEPPHPGHR